MSGNSESQETKDQGPGWVGWKHNLAHWQQGHDPHWPSLSPAQKSAFATHCALWSDMGNEILKHAFKLFELSQPHSSKHLTPHQEWCCTIACVATPFPVMSAQSFPFPSHCYLVCPNLTVFKLWLRDKIKKPSASVIRIDSRRIKRPWFWSDSAKHRSHNRMQPSYPGWLCLSPRH